LFCSVAPLSIGMYGCFSLPVLLFGLVWFDLVLMFGWFLWLVDGDDSCCFLYYDNSLWLLLFISFDIS